MSLLLSSEMDPSGTEACQFGIDNGTGFEPLTTTGVWLFKALRLVLETPFWEGNDARGAPVENDRSCPNGEGDREGLFSRSSID